MQITSIACPQVETVLLRELKHRHSNRLQLIAYSIARCGRQTTLAETRAMLADLEDRLFAHASLDRLLSEAPDPRLFENRCLAICLCLVRTFGREDITPYVHMNDAELSAGQAFWMSLIVAELVANALKHSLAREEGGSIWIDLRRLRQQEVELTVSDSGRALLKRRQRGEPRIVSALVQILSGKIDVFDDDAYVTRVRVPLESKRRHAAEVV